MANSIDLKTLFNSVTQQLADKKETLNEADDYNNNHGDNMVKIFDLVQSAVAQKSDKPIEEQLSYASKVVEQKADSGSGALYAQGLSKAAENFSGKELNKNTITLLLQSIFNSDKSEEKPQSENDNIVGSLISGLTGQSGEPNEADQSFGLDDILQAGTSFFQSKQDGDTNMEAIMDGLMAGSPMKKTPHREQSASIVTSTIMNLIGNLE